MKDIAEHFKVSVATVSRALNGNKRVNEATREAIREYARKHDFHPNDVAKSLRNYKRHPQKIIGVILGHLQKCVA